MSANHSTLVTITRCISGVPRIALPNIGVTENELGHATFTIQTPFGPILVEGCGSRWCCRGNAESLAAHGLLRLDWLPGLPGNNKVSQTVFFGDDGPELFHGNRRGRKFNADLITIKRASSTTFEVTMPATAEQSKSLKLIHKEYHERSLRKIAERRAQQEQDDLKRIQIQLATVSRQEIRDDIRWLVATCENIVADRLNCSAYRFDAAADRGIGEHFKQLLSWIDRGDLQDAELDDPGANVIRLPCRR
ncbi:hypothetical protein ACFDAU_06240 [Sulfuriferula sp. GW1]|uniref:hypothetical protein n=1 Tax=Sulfuriferula sp. GW1 TaxID=3345111 RepID=UPI0039AF0751